MRHSAKFITLLGGHCDRLLTAEAQQQLWTIAILEHTASEYGPWATRTDLCRSPAGRRLECCQGGTDDGAG